MVGIEQDRIEVETLVLSYLAIAPFVVVMWVVIVVCCRISPELTIPNLHLMLCSHAQEHLIPQKLLDSMDYMKISLNLIEFLPLLIRLLLHLWSTLCFLQLSSSLFFISHHHILLLYFYKIILCLYSNIIWSGYLLL